MLKEFLQKVPLFSELPEDQLDRLAHLCQEESQPAYQLIFREGDPVDAFYVVREGLVTVFRDEQGRPLQVLARLEEGGFFGEMGLLNDKARRIASARTAAPTRLLRIDKADLIRLLTDNPGLELKFRSEVIRRHGMNVSALLGLAGQRDVRIRLGVDAVLELEDGTILPVKLENLSIGGVGLSGVPLSWQIGYLVRFRLGRPDEPDILTVSGTVTWREGETVGIAFGPEAAGNAALVHRALRRFLDKRS
ncbi:MAG TPA: cyclic nucleotide-binding domain-containing protein [Thermoanaerobaculia bacterium]|nr:cyclic nucleotide-binding domain-containing protein [Thermoanaerobaculia bacterium]